MQINEVVAANVRAVRGEKRLSLEAAAGVTGVSKSMLGQIERAEVNPTISVLARIAEGYHVPIQSLLETPAETVAVIRNQDLTRQRVGDGQAFRYVISRCTGDSFFLERMEVLPGGGLTIQPPAGCAAFYATLYRGSGTAELEGQTLELNRWDTLRYAGTGEMAIRNTGDQVLQLHLVICYE